VTQQLRVTLGDATATNEGKPELSHDAEGSRSNHGARLILPGTVDPFGDFDLLFGAARLYAKIADVPIRYRERVYGETNIQRFRHGLLLFRMLAIGALKLKFR
jgi:hypothetical protein